MKLYRNNQKSIAYIAVFCMALGLLGQATAVCAQETSGHIIKELVKDVDREMTKLETRVAGFSKKSEGLTNDLTKKLKQLKNTKDEVAKQKILADMLVCCAELNGQDLKEIRAYQETVSSLVPTLEQLKGEIRKLGNMGFKHRDQFTHFRKQMGNTMTNMVRIVKLLRKVQGDNEELRSIENTIVSTYHIFTDPPQSDQTSYAQIDKSIKSMEATFAQLASVEAILKQERLRLRVDNLNQISRLALMRLFSGRVNFTTVADIPTQMMDSVVNRSKTYKEAVACTSGGAMGANGTLYRSHTATGILSKIEKGNPYSN